ncbi:MAG: DUF308 domain-containing protein [Synergistaceae bacterium]|jgi:uncharacterized membrane protein HdeD (DUF308 family)|nr:DUF308 domain-containing protein [Synergistaceae bacterium]
MSDYDSNRIARWTLYTTGAIFALAGVLVIVDSLIEFISPLVLLGVSLLLSGANSLVPHFSMRNNPMRPVWLLPVGVVDIIFGVLSLSHIFKFDIILGVWVMFTGCIRLYMTYALKRSGVAGWRIVLAGAVIMIVIAALLLSRLSIGNIVSGVFLAGIGAAVINEGRTVYGRVPLSR